MRHLALPDDYWGLEQSSGTALLPSAVGGRGLQEGPQVWVLRAAPWSTAQGGLRGTGSRPEPKQLPKAEVREMSGNRQPESKGSRGFGVLLGPTPGAIRWQQKGPMPWQEQVLSVARAEGRLGSTGTRKREELQTKESFRGISLKTRMLSRGGEGSQPRHGTWGLRQRGTNSSVLCEKEAQASKTSVHGGLWCRRAWVLWVLHGWPAGLRPGSSCFVSWGKQEAAKPGVARRGGAGTKAEEPGNAPHDWGRQWHRAGVHTLFCKGLESKCPRRCRSWALLQQIGPMKKEQDSSTGVREMGQ